MNMYFALLSMMYIIVYIFGIIWFQIFVNHKIKLRVSLFDVMTIIAVFFMILVVVFYIADEEIANRVQHGLGGGFIVTFIAFLSYRASQVELSKFVLFHLFFLLATTFGVFNELLESIFQLQFGLIFSQNLADTWYDLWANTVGALFGAGFFAGIAKK